MGNPTRPIFWFISPHARTVFYALSFAAVLWAAWDLTRLVRKWLRGRPAPITGDWRRRIANAIATVSSNRGNFAAGALSGVTHFAVMWSFFILFLGTVTLTVDYDIVRPLTRTSFFRGSFYLGYSLVLDLFGAAFVLALLGMLVYRWFRRPARLTRHAHDLMLPISLLVLGISGFSVETYRIAVTYPPFEVWSPVGFWLATVMRQHASGVLGWKPSVVYPLMWWTHSVLCLVWIAWLPHTLAKHLISVPANILLQPANVARLPLPDLDAEDLKLGAALSTDFTWKQRLSFDACTGCGLCEVNCPAVATGTTLDPKLVIQKLGAAVNAERVQEPAVLIGGPIIEDELWSCTTCGACMAACPVAIEHVHDIVDMRRHLVFDGRVPSTITPVLENLNRYGNPYGEVERARAKWAEDIGFAVKDLSKKPQTFEVLLYIDSASAYIPRNQKSAVALARIFQASGVDWAILGEKEKDCGDFARRVGEEALFQFLAKKNIENFQQHGVRTIVVLSPHALNTFKNEYPDLGGNFEVLHYSQFLVRLLEQGRLSLNENLATTVSFHDPCYLGRYNKEFEAPRQLLRAAGANIRELPRTRERSFCCGGGGGGMWYEPGQKTQRMSEIRLKEALDSGTPVLVAACPFCIQNFEEAKKTVTDGSRMQVMDLAEFVAQALGLEPAIESNPQRREEQRSWILS